MQVPEQHIEPTTPPPAYERAELSQPAVTESIPVVTQSVPTQDAPVHEPISQPAVAAASPQDHSHLVAPPLPPRTPSSEGSQHHAPALPPRTDHHAEHVETDASEPFVESDGQSYLATIAFLLPFCAYENYSLKPKDAEKVPPFCLYSPLHPRLSKPAEGEKESMAHKAQRKWEQEEDEAAKTTGIKSKAIHLISKGMSATKNSATEFLIRTPSKKELKELRIIYPSNYQADQLKEDFQKFVKTAKSGSIKSSVFSTVAVPFALAFDTVTFIPGPFEVCCVWSASSWTGTARASAIANGVTSDKVTLGFIPDRNVDSLQHRLHELCWQKAHKGMVAPPKWHGDGHPARQSELADNIFSVLRQQLPNGESSYDTDRTRVGHDIESQLEKAAKEFVKAIS